MENHVKMHCRKLFTIYDNLVIYFEVQFYIQFGLEL